jgi:hypothetical protein
MLGFAGLLAALSAAGCAGGPDDGVGGNGETVTVRGALTDWPLCPPNCPIPSRLRSTGPQCLCLPAPMPTFGLQNLARKPVAHPAQSCTAFNGEAIRAVDGIVDGDYTHNSVTHTDIYANHGPVEVDAPGATPDQQWWTVDLGAIRGVRHATIYNRTDCCADRLGSFTIWGINPGSGNWMNLGGANMNSNSVIDIDLTDVNTQTFWLQKNDTNYLSLAEVQVWGVVLP